MMKQVAVALILSTLFVEETLSQVDNIALSFSGVSSSSEAYGGRPKYAVDNDISTVHDVASGQCCFHSSAGDTTPWFQLLLDNSYTVKNIRLYNRCANATLLTNIKTYVDGRFCNKQEEETSNEWLDFRCPPDMSGSNITVTKEGEYLAICEIQAFSYNRSDTSGVC